MKVVQFIKTLILLGFGTLLSNLIISGQYRQYVHPRFEIALIVACGFFFILAVVQGVNTFSEHEENHPHHHCHAHQTDFKHEVTVCVLLALPLIFSFCLPASNLGSDMVGKKTSSPVRQGKAFVFAQTGQANEWNPVIEDNTFLISMMILYAQPADYAGKEIEFSGFVYHQDNFPEGTFLLARYAITCCAADAQVTGLLCRFPESREIPNDQWLRVKGKIVIESYQDCDIPIVDVSSLQSIQTPGNPYVY
ncbi:MAG: TIGR03943 family protein [Clostridia bacterium]|nr:TIGR03943 family protein [Clostridia bacterium]